MANEGMIFSDIQVQWHPAFCAAAELGLSANRGDLEFRREYNLSKKPLQVDLLVVEKRDGVSIKNEIGQIFRRYNIIEYKSPGDGLSIDDFFKVAGYACIYKGLGETVNQIPAEQMTVSLVREGKPVELLRMLEGYGLKAHKKFCGIYYVEGFFFPVQIVVTKELGGGTDGENVGLRVLSRDALEEDVQKFIEMAQNLTSPGDRANVDAVLQASVSANYGLYKEMKRRDPVMCEAMRRLMKDEIQEGEEKGRREGEMKGRQEGEMKGRREGEMKGRRDGILETLFGLVKDGILTVADAAKRANMKDADFEKAYKMFLL